MITSYIIKFLAKYHDTSRLAKIIFKIFTNRSITIEKILSCNKKNSILYIKILTGENKIKNLHYETAAGFYLYNKKIENQLIRLLQKELTSEEQSHIISEIKINKDLKIIATVDNPEIIKLGDNKEKSTIIKIYPTSMLVDKINSILIDEWRKYEQPMAVDIYNVSIQNRKIDAIVKLNNNSNIPLETGIGYNCANEETYKKIIQYNNLLKI